MKKEADELLADMLADENRLRETTLQRGLAEMHRVRKRRHTMRVTVAVCLPVLVLAATIYVRDLSTNRNSTHDTPLPITQIEKTIRGTSIRVLNDEELLDLFNGRPVALIGPAGHQQLILFDEVPN